MSVSHHILLRDPLFHGSDNYDQLSKIAKVLGTEELFQYLGKCDLDLDPEFDEGEHQLFNYPRKAWLKFVNAAAETATCMSTPEDGDEEVKAGEVQTSSRAYRHTDGD